MLKQCPCCGAEAKFINYAKGSGGMPLSRIRCTSCGLQTRMKRDMCDALIEWNRRTDLPTALK